MDAGVATSAIRRPARRPSRVLLLLAVASAVALAAAVADAQAANIPAPDMDPFYAQPANIAGLANGTVIASRSITAMAGLIPMPAKAWQVKFKSQDNTGAAAAYMTTVMVSTVPWTGEGPRPVLSYQTAEDGVGTKCSPSYAIRDPLQATLDGSGGPSETTLMQLALQRGWTVVVPDYEGPRSMFLGSDGEARGVLDSLRAARAFAPARINNAAPLALWGYSGGALATADAAQMQPSYAPKLKLSGIALGGVVADIKATMNAFSGSAGGGALVMGFVGVDRSYPQYHLQQYINAKGRAAIANSQTDCLADAAAKYPFAKIADYTNNPALIDSPAFAPLFAAISPLSRPGTPAAPVYDYHAVDDEFAPIGPDRELMARYCAAGVAVDHVEFPVGEHLTEAVTGAPGALAYLADRFAGLPAPDNCTVPPHPQPTASHCTATRDSPHAYVLTKTIHATRRGISMRGKAFTPCDPTIPLARRRVTKVSVAIARLAGGRCQFLKHNGRLSRPRACKRPINQTASGASTWRYRQSTTLPPGRYLVWVRAIDEAGSRQARPVRPSARFNVS